MHIIKQTISLLLLPCSSLLYAQVGINTNAPQRMLDVNGNLKISTISDASHRSNYNNILATNARGDVDFILKSDLLPKPDATTSNKESYSVLYNTSDGKGLPSQKLTCGRFQFSFDDSSTTLPKIRMNLSKAPTGNVDIYISMEQNWDNKNGGGFEYNSPTTVFRQYTTKNWNEPAELPGATVADFEQNVLSLIYPGEPDFYRITIYKVRHSARSVDFSVNCEKF